MTAKLATTILIATPMAACIAAIVLGIASDAPVDMMLILFALALPTVAVAMLIFGLPMLWISVRFIPDQFVVRTALIVVAGVIAGIPIFHQANTPNLSVARQDLWLGGSLGGVAALIAALTYIYLDQEPQSA